MCFDATGSCKKLKRTNNTYSGPLFLYDGVMKVNEQTFTVLSMISERHDNISIRTWIQRWLQCGVQAPKIVISDQSLALMSALIQSFTQYTSLEKYLNACFSIVQGKPTNIELPSCYIRNDVNHFVHLITQWPTIKNSKYVRTKQLFVRAMGLLIFCTDLNEARQILEATFIIAFSETDGLDKEGRLTPCAESKIYLKNRITASVIDFVSPNLDKKLDSDNTSANYPESNDINTTLNMESSSFKEWAKSIANDCELKVATGMKGVEDNVQYELPIVPLKINVMKLFPCWSGIMRPVFKYGNETASSSRIESHFNNLKHNIFKNEKLPIRVDSFLEKLVTFYKGDNLLLQTSTPCHVVSNVKQLEERDVDGSDEKITGEVQEIYSCDDGADNELQNMDICDIWKEIEDPHVNVIRINNKNELVENSEREIWKKKSSTQKLKRNVSSYLSSQPGFEHLLNLNQKGSSASIFFLKNGNIFKNRPIKLSGVDGKFILSNTCAIDSIMSVLACSASDSQLFHSFLLTTAKTNPAAQFILNMLKHTGKNIYTSRLELLFSKFESRQLLGELKIIDVTDTAAGMTKKMFNSMPSITWEVKCSNEICQKYQIKTTITSTVISINIFGDEIDLQQQLENIIEIEELCDCCNRIKNTTSILEECVIIEINSIPEGLHDDTSKMIESAPPDTINQNYIMPYKIPLKNMIKKIKLKKLFY